MVTKTQTSWGLLFEHSQMPLFHYNFYTHKILDANQLGQQLLGYDSIFLRKANFSDFLLDNPLGWTQQFKLLNTEVLPQWDTNILSKNQEIKNVEIKTISLPDEEDCCLLSVIEIQSKQDEIQELEDKLSFYETILMEMPSEFAVLNANWQYLFVNHNSIKDPVFRAWMIGKTDYDFCRYRNKDFKIAENRHKQYKELARTRLKKEWIDEHITKEGTKKFILRKLYPYFKEDELNMNFGFGIDITERVIAEQDRENFLKELTKQNEELKQFAHITSHDLKEPLRTVSGFASILKRKYAEQLDARGLEFLQFIVEGTDRMSSMLTSLKSFVVLDSAQMEEKVVAVDIKTVINSVIENLKLLIRESNSVLDIPEHLPTIKGHPEYLTQLFQNLIINGIKFCEENPQIQIRWKEEKTHIVFSIIDNGIGINSKHIDKIFRLFNRLKKNRTEGTGMGLAICKKVVQLHKGKIWVESDGSSGSTFSFTLGK